VRVLGYSVCVTCSQPVLTEVARVTEGRCPGCFRDQHGGTLKLIEVMVAGERMKVRTGPNRKRRSNRGRRETKLAVAAAKRRAYKRLRAAFPDLYDMLLAEERARAGLDPYPLTSVLGQGTGAPETIDFAATYHALARHGVDLNGPQERGTESARPGP
jgi:hypothetical protein